MNGVRITLCLLLVTFAAACEQPDLAKQPRLDPYEATGTFADGRSARERVPGTVARGDLERARQLAERPSVTLELLRTGKERYEQFCMPCHGFLGSGDGMVVQRGFPQPPDLSSERLRAVPDEYLVQVIGEGYGVMYGYGSRIEPADRWAISFYVRALQLAADAPADAVPPIVRQQLAAPHQLTAAGVRSVSRAPASNRMQGAQFFLLATGCIAASLSAVLAYVDLPGALQAWLVAVQYWIAFPLGALGVLLVLQLTGGSWGTWTAPVAVTALRCLPLFVVPILLLLLGLDTLMSWTGDADTLAAVVKAKQFYLDTTFFRARNIAYLLIWLLLAWKLGAWSARSPGAGMAAAGLLLWLLTLTYFTTDWIQALEPTWYTDVLGFIFAAEVAGVFLSLTLLVMALLNVAGDTRSPVSRMYSDLSSLWLAAIVAWILLTFSQYIVIWSANLPHEIGWYLHRQTPGRLFEFFVGAACFAVIPFFALLSGKTRTGRKRLMALAVGSLLGHVLIVDWTVSPSFASDGWLQVLQTGVAMLALGSFCIFVSLRSWPAIARRNS